MSLSSGNTLRRDISTKFDVEKVKMRHLFQPIEKVSVIVHTWTIANHLAILRMTIYWVDDIWNLYECVLAVEELCESHGGIHGKSVT